METCDGCYGELSEEEEVIADGDNQYCEVCYEEKE